MRTSELVQLRARPLDLLGPLLPTVQLSRVYYVLIRARFQDPQQKPHVRRNGDFSYALRAQERIVLQAWVLPAFLLLLPLPVRSASISRLHNLLTCLTRFSMIIALISESE